ncbi:corticotropin-releasing factor receptor 1-like [Macrobrachium nipponense]|uniref:corticotropin-releasing factor receptor 1-like n=1 Tax=Macrobrachium nipponense TaxID=159736 RepID=UPI0030C8B2D5
MDAFKAVIFIQILASFCVATATNDVDEAPFSLEDYAEVDDNAPTQMSLILDGKNHTASSLASTTSLEMCRMGFGVMDYYPTEENYYHHQTCFWCYFFTPPHRRKYNLKVVTNKITLSDGKTRMDVMFSDKNSTHYFDPDDGEGWMAVTSSLSDILEAAKLEGCCREAVSCCERNLLHTYYMQNKTSESEGKVLCPATWDGWSCFPDTPAGEVVSFVCPPHAYKGQPECALEGTKTCWPNGSWARDPSGREQTEYATCSHRHYHLINYYWEVTMHAASMVVLIPAVIIIPYYRPLRAQRFILHLNLFWALFFKAFFSLLDVAVLRIPEYTETNTLLDDNAEGCKILVFLTKVFSVAVWSWMLSESLYLHRLIVAAFSGRGKTYVYVLVGWVPPVVLGCSWAVSRALLEDYQCWLGDQHGDDRHLYLITELPKLIILVVNTILLANMTRVVVTQMRSVSDDGAVANKRAVKATMFLLPMFGLQFFITFVVPPYTTPCIGMHVYSFLATGVDGLQGLYVAVVYCYMNQEVKNQVGRSLHHLRGTIYKPLSTSYATYDPKTEVSQIHSSVSHSVDS